MKNIQLSPASFGLLTSLFCGATTILFGCFWFLSAASQDVKIVNQPAAEGHTITPAGTLLLDATTRLPAVAPLTVDFVRSPDKNGPDGKGRFLNRGEPRLDTQINRKPQTGQARPLFN